MLRVGLTGGYATGKSYVAQQLQQMGCEVIYADKLGYQVMLPGGSAYQGVVSLLGDDILSADGTVDRRKAAALVFGNPELLEKLNGLIHPAVYRSEAEMVAEFAKHNPEAIVVTEAAILIETGRYKCFDKLVVTVCSYDHQLQRAMHRDHLREQEVVQRLSHQMPAAEKVKYADYVIETDGPKDITIARVRAVHDELKHLASRQV